MFLKVGQPGQEGHGFMLPLRKNIFLCKGNLCICWYICLHHGMHEAPSLLHALLQYLSSQQAITASSSRTVLQLRHQQIPLPQAISEITLFKARGVKNVTLWKTLSTASLLLHLSKLQMDPVTSSILHQAGGAATGDGTAFQAGP